MFAHRMSVGFVGVLTAIAHVAAAQENGEQPAAPPGYQKTAPLLEKLGRYHHRVETGVPLAQRYFDQGMVLSFGFNHAEAARAFREAQKLDPNCAMAYWGEALVLGPNINSPMDKENVPKAWAAVQKALDLERRASPRHRAYIRALAKRYAEKPPEDRNELDLAYAAAMREVVQKYPDDYDAQVLLAEALMDTTPWDYWLEGGKPKPVTEEILRALEIVLARRPGHPMANHLYIHAVEAAHPEWGEAAANRLGQLAPGAGHLVHMPAHIFIRVGRFADASEANERAIKADDGYVAQCHAQGIYPLAYMPHNHHFLWFAASMEGRAERSIHAAMHMGKHVDAKLMREPGYGTLQHFYILPLYALARFGRWETVREYPPPDKDLKYPTGVWHFAQGMARVRSGELEAAAEHSAALSKLAADEDLDKVTIWGNNSTRHILQVGEQVLAGELAAARRDYKSAVAHLRKAVELEDAMRYEEPQLWHAPTRQTLGAILLEADRPAEAEAAYRADLERYPANGWSLFGLQKALAAQGKDDEANRVKAAFEKAWSHADVKLTSSRF